MFFAPGWVALGFPRIGSPPLRRLRNLVDARMTSTASRWRDEGSGPSDPSRLVSEYGWGVGSMGPTAYVVLVPVSGRAEHALRVRTAASARLPRASRATEE